MNINQKFTRNNLVTSPDFEINKKRQRILDYVLNKIVESYEAAIKELEHKITIYESELFWARKRRYLY